MATPDSIDSQAMFTEIEGCVSSVLDGPISLLSERKQYLLGKITEVREEYNEKKSEQLKNIEELKAAKDELLCISSLMKENQAQGELHKSMANLQEKITVLELEIPTPPKMKFTYELDQLKQIENFIRNFGEIEFEKTKAEMIDKQPNTVDTPVEKQVYEVQPKKTVIPGKQRDYTTIKTHQTKVAKFGKGESEVSDPGYIYIDEVKAHVYVCDGGNGRIQVFTTSGDYVRSFGNNQLVSPVGIVLCREEIFVTDFFKQCLLKYNSAFACVKKLGRKQGYTFSYPHGIDTDDNEVFVAEPFKHKISVFSLELEYLRTLGTGIIKKCYAIKVREGVITALEYSTNTIKLLQAQSGELIRSISINKDGVSVFNGTFLSIDPFGNFIITDMVADLMKILNPDGLMLSLINFKQWKSHEPKAVCFTSDNKMFTGFSEGEFSILIL